jgi:hypothetical protein
VKFILKALKFMAAIIILSNREMSLAGCTRGLTRVEMTQSESGPNSIKVVDAIRRMREVKL